MSATGCAGVDNDPGTSDDFGFVAVLREARHIRVDVQAFGLALGAEIHGCKAAQYADRRREDRSVGSRRDEDRVERELGRMNGDRRGFRSERPDFCLDIGDEVIAANEIARA